ncbi:GntR family transcriptional regulator [Natronobacillus azotifigens]|uniref:GntR family transcriptional regulator n=1 Tax=Natronobacillus azotifigens TaxID=472978 RepID=A0A9J6R7M4_9BACI|nr:GntR family transcriptional regulator [Natronobacillus azotifigens]MCZ0701634.1 GntR family transcriptional regulator [Natronobacillus azotifigens]
MSKEFQSSKPIYMQIVDSIVIDILQNKQKPAEKLPSVREMAVKMGVNPNTIQRAYGELERMNVVETRRGQGTFVLDNATLLDELKTSMQKEIIENYVEQMLEIGVSNKDMIEQLQNYLEGCE